eukprot:scaffold614174_cov26-Prasinocladus_malaysianus.AAC.2
MTFALISRAFGRAGAEDPRAPPSIAERGAGHLASRYLSCLYSSRTETELPQVGKTYDPLRRIHHTRPNTTFVKTNADSNEIAVSTPALQLSSIVHGRSLFALCSPARSYVGAGRFKKVREFESPSYAAEDKLGRAQRDRQCTRDVRTTRRCPLQHWHAVWTTVVSTGTSEGQLLAASPNSPGSAGDQHRARLNAFTTSQKFQLQRQEIYLIVP